MLLSLKSVCSMSLKILRITKVQDVEGVVVIDAGNVTTINPLAGIVV